MRESGKAALILLGKIIRSCCESANHQNSPVKMRLPATREAGSSSWNGRSCNLSRRRLEVIPKPVDKFNWSCPCGAVAAHLISYLYPVAARTRIAQLLRCSRNTVIKWLRRARLAELQPRNERLQLTAMRKATRSSFLSASTPKAQMWASVAQAAEILFRRKI